MLESENLFYICRFMVAVSMIISFIEIVSLRDEFKKGGLFNLSLNRNFRNAYLSKSFRPIINLATNYKSVLITGLCKAICGTILLFKWTNPLLILVLLIVSTLATLLFHLSMVSGKDGADQMTLCVLFGLVISYYGFWTSNNTIVNIGVLAIVGQSSLSYFTAGVAKLFGKLWKNGDALTLILSTRSFGNSSINKLFLGNIVINKTANYFVIAIEVLFPLALFLPLPYTLIILGLCVILHISIALTMGLNRFFWSFVATYPCMIYFNIFILHQQ